MADCPRLLNLLLEALDESGVSRYVVTNRLQCDRILKLDIERLVYFAHSALAEGLHNAKSAANNLFRRKDGAMRCWSASEIPYACGRRVVSTLVLDEQTRHLRTEIFVAAAGAGKECSPLARLPLQRAFEELSDAVRALWSHEPLTYHSIAPWSTHARLWPNPVASGQFNFARVRITLSWMLLVEGALSPACRRRFSAPASPFGALRRRAAGSAISSSTRPVAVSIIFVRS